MTKKNLRLAVGILSMNLLLMGASAVGAAIAAIAKSFPTEPISKVQMLSTVPQLGQIIATFLFAWLTYHLTRKNVGMLAVAVVAVSGLLPVFFNSSLNLILACMIAMGFGLGLITNVVPVLLQEHFEGEQRATVMGWSVGFNNIGMMAMTAIGGVLGGSNWHNLFWIYIIAVIILVAVFFMVPQDIKTPRVVKTADDQEKKVGLWSTLAHLNGRIYIILGITLIMSLIMTMFMANESILLASKGQGTSYTAIITAIWEYRRHFNRVLT
ncbi:MFS transporter [Lactobacillus selangorensis]|nr:MFS transporter [Lactobacillus selangorensis]